MKLFKPCKKTSAFNRINLFGFPLRGSFGECSGTFESCNSEYGQCSGDYKKC